MSTLNEPILTMPVTQPNDSSPDAATIYLQQGSPLFLLPPEIRNYIFTLALTANPGPQPYRAGGKPHEHVGFADNYHVKHDITTIIGWAIDQPPEYPRIRGTGLLRTCKRAYAEALPYLYDRTFGFGEGCTEAVMGFLRAIGSRERACVTRAEMGNFVSKRKGGWVDIKDVWELIEGCANLRSVRVRVRLDEYDLWELENGDGSEHADRGRALGDRVVSGHQVASLRGFQSVEVVPVSSLERRDVERLKAVVEPVFREVLMGQRQG